ncbi:hypothetical protein J6590_080237 [Homalodisca vitripennis]|nr:hypothetical protein J6590_080237 [Homalodisca vitripennis]
MLFVILVGRAPGSNFKTILINKRAKARESCNMLVQQSFIAYLEQENGYQTDGVLKSSKALIKS